MEGCYFEALNYLLGVFSAAAEARQPFHSGCLCEKDMMLSNSSNTKERDRKE